MGAWVYGCMGVYVYAYMYTHAHTLTLKLMRVGGWSGGTLNMDTCGCGRIHRVRVSGLRLHNEAVSTP